MGSARPVPAPRDVSVQGKGVDTGQGFVLTWDYSLILIAASLSSGTPLSLRSEPFPVNTYKSLIFTFFVTLDSYQSFGIMV